MKDIVGFEGLYAVTQDGRIWSYPKKWRVGNKNQEFFESKGRWMKLCRNHKGYLQVRLCNNYKKSTYPVHKLVAKHFVKNEKNLPTVNHKNGDKTDNRARNLEWCTNTENIRHAFKNGFYKNRHLGSKNPAAKLTEEKVLEMRRTYQMVCALLGVGPEKFTFEHFGKKYGVSGATACQIVRRKNWKHI